MLLTGVHLMRTGEVVAHLPSLVERYGAPAYLPDLVEAKAADEHRRCDQLDDPPDHDRLAADVAEWSARLEAERDSSGLPDAATAEPALDDLLRRERMAAR